MNLFNDHLNLSNNIYDNAKILKSVELNKQQELVNRNPTTKYYQTLALNLQEQVQYLTRQLNEADGQSWNSGTGRDGNSDVGQEIPFYPTEPFATPRKPFRPFLDAWIEDNILNPAFNGWNAWHAKRVRDVDGLINNPPNYQYPPNSTRGVGSGATRVH